MSSSPLLLFRWLTLVTFVGVLLFARFSGAYPTDLESYERTNIRRLKWQHDVDEGERRGRQMPPGARWPAERIQLKMLDTGSDFELTKDTPKDPALQAGLEDILERWRWRRYNVALVDISDPANPRWAGVNEHEQQTPGSVAKLLVGAGVLQQLKERFPHDTKRREQMLRETMVTADHWAMPNHHEVPVLWGDELEHISIRRVRAGDTFSLWEWMDHALSPSSNASASMLWREGTLMEMLGEQYPPAKWDEELYARWDRDQWTEAAFEVVNRPLINAGLGTDDFFVRMFFTHNANKYIRSSSSRASPFGLVRWMLKVEQGKMVDEWASLELKKMMYLTRRRVRYLYGNTLDDCAGFFKSGSLYKCKPEPGFTCIQYRGNVVNALNALVEIETRPPKLTPIAKEDLEQVRAELARANAEAVGAAEVAKSEAEKAAKSEAALASASSQATAAEMENKEAGEGETAHAEKPELEQRVYIIAVMSNELKRNAALDHANLAKEIHALILAN